MAILHAAHDREVHPLARPLAGETEVAGEFHDADVIARTLSDAGIQSLIYLGYFSNMCILRRSTGMIEMQKRGFKTILVRDASAAKESEASMAGGEFHAAMVHFIELNLGATITAAEVQAAISACSGGEHAKAAAGSVVKVPNA
jgi:nicotinamidase-related amidase